MENKSRRWESNPQSSALWCDVPSSDLPVKFVSREICFIFQENISTSGITRGVVKLSARVTPNFRVYYFHNLGQKRASTTRNVTYHASFLRQIFQDRLHHLRKAQPSLLPLGHLDPSIYCKALEAHRSSCAHNLYLGDGGSLKCSFHPNEYLN